MNNKKYIVKLLNEGYSKRILLEELSLLIEKEISVGTKLKKKLDNINKPFADKLLQFLNSNSISDKVTIDSIDFTDDDDKTLTGYYKDRDGNAKVRKFKVGKLLNYLGIGTQEFKGYELEELIAHLKKGTTEDFKVVEGDKILWAYHCENYDEGETMGSCMRYEAAQAYLKIYTENPEHVKCLVLINPNNNKVRGRALLWHTSEDVTFMDRVYLTNNEYKNLFLQYAEENGFTTNTNGEVDLDYWEFEKYPFMDTFEYLNKDNGKLMTDSDDNYETVALTDTDGGVSEPGVMIELGDRQGEIVNEDEAYYLSYKTPNGYIEGYAHADNIIHIDGELYLDDDCVKTYNNETVFKYNDDEMIVELTAGVYEGDYAKFEDTIELEYNHYGEGQYITMEDDYVDIDNELYEVPHAFHDDTIETYDGKIIIKDDAVTLHEKFYDEYKYGHREDSVRVNTKNDSKVWVLVNDLDKLQSEIIETINTKVYEGLIGKLVRKKLRNKDEILN